MSRVRTGGAAEVRVKYAKALEFLAVARQALADEHPNAAASAAVTAAINANDVLCLLRLQHYSSADNHFEALKLTRQCGPVGRRVATALERVLAAKNTAQYEAASIRLADATTIVQRAARIVDLVGDEVAGA